VDPGILQMGDAFYPTGAYAHSFGLAGLVEQGSGGVTGIECGADATFGLWTDNFLTAHGR